MQRPNLIFDQSNIILQYGDALSGHGAPESDGAVVAAARHKSVAIGPAAAEAHRGHALPVPCKYVHEQIPNANKIGMCPFFCWWQNLAGQYNLWLRCL